MFSLPWGQGQELCVLDDLVEIEHLHLLHLTELPILVRTSSFSAPQKSPYERERVNLIVIQCLHV